VAVVVAIRLANASSIRGFEAALDVVAGKTSLEIVGAGVGVFREGDAGRGTGSGSGTGVEVSGTGTGVDLALVVGASIAFVLVTTQLGWICLALSPVALGIVFWYSLAKRFTTYTQLFLGLALAVAPVGGWLAAGGRGGWEPWLLALAMGAWVAGFDIFYACQDLEFDRAQGLRSIPARFGVRVSLAIARWLHLFTVAARAAVALVAPLGSWYLAGVAGVALLLAYEQSLVRPDDLSRVKQAFDLNGYVGLFYLTATAAEIYVG